MNKAYYLARLSEFCNQEDSFILGELTRSHRFALEHQQRQAWLDQLGLLRAAVGGLADAHILFEFAIPRMGKRADVLLVTKHVVLVIEFKVGLPLSTASISIRCMTTPSI